MSTGAPTEPNDVSHSFKTQREELHPDPQANGPATVDFFKNNFNFSGRETVAILGAHTLGRLHVEHSLLRYVWKTRSAQLFNNGYYRNLAKKNDWYYPTEGRTDGECAGVGNSKGEKPEARWMPVAWGDTVVGGNVQWLNEKLVCMADNPNCTEAEEVWRFVSGADETMLSSDMGLYLDFDTDQNGIPFGCEGFEDFNMEKWGRTSTGALENKRFTWTRVNGMKAEPKCGLNKMPGKGPGTMAMHEIVEEYADNQDKWLADFIPALEKVLSNGYSDTALTQAPSSGMNDVDCAIQNPYDGDRIYKCF